MSHRVTVGFASAVERLADAVAGLVGEQPGGDYSCPKCTGSGTTKVDEVHGPPGEKSFQCDCVVLDADDNPVREKYTDADGNELTRVKTKKFHPVHASPEVRAEVAMINAARRLEAFAKSKPAPAPAPAAPPK